MFRRRCDNKDDGDASEESSSSSSYDSSSNGGGNKNLNSLQLAFAKKFLQQHSSSDGDGDDDNDDDDGLSLFSMGTTSIAPPPLDATASSRNNQNDDDKNGGDGTAGTAASNDDHQHSPEEEEEEAIIGIMGTVREEEVEQEVDEDDDDQATRNEDSSRTNSISRDQELVKTEANGNKSSHCDASTILRPLQDEKEEEASDDISSSSRMDHGRHDNVHDNDDVPSLDDRKKGQQQHDNPQEERRSSSSSSSSSSYSSHSGRRYAFGDDNDNDDDEDDSLDQMAQAFLRERARGGDSVEDDGSSSSNNEEFASPAHLDNDDDDSLDQIAQSFLQERAREEQDDDDDDHYNNNYHDHDQQSDEESEQRHHHIHDDNNDDCIALSPNNLQQQQQHNASFGRYVGGGKPVDDDDDNDDDARQQQEVPARQQQQCFDEQDDDDDDDATTDSHDNDVDAMDQSSGAPDWDAWHDKNGRLHQDLEENVVEDNDDDHVHDEKNPLHCSSCHSNPDSTTTTSGLERAFSVKNNNNDDDDASLDPMAESSLFLHECAHGGELQSERDVKNDHRQHVDNNQSSHDQRTGQPDGNSGGGDENYDKNDTLRRRRHDHSQEQQSSSYSSSSSNNDDGSTNSRFAQRAFQNHEDDDDNDDDDALDQMVRSFLQERSRDFDCLDDTDDDDNDIKHANNMPTSNVPQHDDSLDPDSDTSDGLELQQQQQDDSDDNENDPWNLAASDNPAHNINLRDFDTFSHHGHDQRDYSQHSSSLNVDNIIDGDQRDNLALLKDNDSKSGGNLHASSVDDDGDNNESYFMPPPTAANPPDDSFDNTSDDIDTQGQTTSSEVMTSRNWPPKANQETPAVKDLSSSFAVTTNSSTPALSSGTALLGEEKEEQNTSVLLDQRKDDSPSDRAAIVGQQDDHTDGLSSLPGSNNVDGELKKDDADQAVVSKKQSDRSESGSDVGAWGWFKNRLTSNSTTLASASTVNPDDNDDGDGKTGLHERPEDSVVDTEETNRQPRETVAAKVSNNDSCDDASYSESSPPSTAHADSQHEEQDCDISSTGTTWRKRDDHPDQQKQDLPLHDSSHSSSCHKDDKPDEDCDPVMDDKAERYNQTSGGGGAWGWFKNRLSNNGTGTATEAATKEEDSSEQPKKGQQQDQKETAVTEDAPPEFKEEIAESKTTGTAGGSRDAAAVEAASFESVIEHDGSTMALDHLSVPQHDSQRLTNSDDISGALERKCASNEDDDNDEEGDPMSLAKAFLDLLQPDVDSDEEGSMKSYVSNDRHESVDDKNGQNQHINQHLLPNDNSNLEQHQDSGDEAASSDLATAFPEDQPGVYDESDKPTDKDSTTIPRSTSGKPDEPSKDESTDSINEMDLPARENDEAHRQHHVLESSFVDHSGSEHDHSEDENGEESSSRGSSSSDDDEPYKLVVKEAPLLRLENVTAQTRSKIPLERMERRKISGGNGAWGWFKNRLATTTPATTSGLQCTAPSATVATQAENQLQNKTSATAGAPSELPATAAPAVTPFPVEDSRESSTISKTESVGAQLTAADSRKSKDSTETEAPAPSNGERKASTMMNPRDKPRERRRNQQSSLPPTPTQKVATTRTSNTSDGQTGKQRSPTDISGSRTGRREKKPSPGSAKTTSNLNRQPKKQRQDKKKEKKDRKKGRKGGGLANHFSQAPVRKISRHGDEVSVGTMNIKQHQGRQHVISLSSNASMYDDSSVHENKDASNKADRPWEAERPKRPEMAQTPLGINAAIVEEEDSLEDEQDADLHRSVLEESFSKFDEAFNFAVKEFDKMEEIQEDCSLAVHDLQHVDSSTEEDEVAGASPLELSALEAVLMGNESGSLLDENDRGVNFDDMWDTMSADASVLAEQQRKEQHQQRQKREEYRRNQNQRFGRTEEHDDSDEEEERKQERQPPPERLRLFETKTKATGSSKRRKSKDTLSSEFLSAIKEVFEEEESDVDDNDCGSVVSDNLENSASEEMVDDSDGSDNSGLYTRSEPPSTWASPKSHQSRVKHEPDSDEDMSPTKEHLGRSVVRNLGDSQGQFTLSSRSHSSDENSMAKSRVSRSSARTGRSNRSKLSTRSTRSGSGRRKMSMPKMDPAEVLAIEQQRQKEGAKDMSISNLKQEMSDRRGASTELLRKEYEKGRIQKQLSASAHDSGRPKLHQLEFSKPEHIVDKAKSVRVLSASLHQEEKKREDPFDGDTGLFSSSLTKQDGDKKDPNNMEGLSGSLHGHLSRWDGAESVGEMDDLKTIQLDLASKGPTGAGISSLLTGLASQMPNAPALPELPSSLLATVSEKETKPSEGAEEMMFSTSFSDIQMAGAALGIDDDDDENGLLGSKDEYDGPEDQSSKKSGSGSRRFGVKMKAPVSLKNTKIGGSLKKIGGKLIPKRTGSANNASSSSGLDFWMGEDDDESSLLG